METECLCFALFRFCALSVVWVPRVMYNFKPFDYIHVIYVIAIRCNIFSFMNFVFCGVLKVNCKSKISDVSNNYSEFSFLKRNSVKARCPISSDLIYI